MINKILVVILVNFGKLARYSLVPINSDSVDSFFDVINK